MTDRVYPLDDKLFHKRRKEVHELMKVGYDRIDKGGVMYITFIVWSLLYNYIQELEERVCDHD